MGTDLLSNGPVCADLLACRLKLMVLILLRRQHLPENRPAHSILTPQLGLNTIDVMDT